MAGYIMKPAMAFPLDQPFPFPASPPLERYPGAEAIRTYLDIFLNRRHERPAGKLADADIFMFMRLAEHLGKVTNIELQYVRKELLVKKEDLFANEAQKARLRIFAANHDRRNAASRQDDFLKEVFRIPAIPYFRTEEAARMMAKAKALSEAIDAARASYIEHGSDDPVLVDAVNTLSNDLAGFIEGFTLSDVDEVGKVGREARRRDLANYFRRLDGEVDHEAKFDAATGTWKNWNRDISVFPETYFGNKADVKPSAVAKVIRNSDPVRIVAGGHAFNTGSDTGGTKSAAFGTLITLDRLTLEDGAPWKLIAKADAEAAYDLADGSHVVRASAGMRLRDFTEQMWEQGMALPVAGSTDAQSLGGLIATDLHSTGHTAGLLSQLLLEVVALDSNGKMHTFRRSDAVAHGQPGRWTWIKPNGSAELTRLPPAGGIGMTGVVVEAVLQLVSGFIFEKHERFVDRKWLEANIEKFLDPAQNDKDFAYPHVSLYYTGGFGPSIRSVQLNTWRRTNKTPPPNALKIKRQRELLDHVGSAFFPDALFGLANKKAPSFPDNKDGDAQLRQLNGRDAQILQANHAFARKLYFQHDEIEAGIPLPLLANGRPDYQVFRDAIKATQLLLHKEELKTIIEVRFTPDVSEGMLGPGTGGPTCYIELATSMALYSRDRIVQVFQQFDKMLRQDFGARPHLGKKTSVKASEMLALYGEDWKTFNGVRKTIDPGGKFRPQKNEFLNRLFA